MSHTLEPITSLYIHWPFCPYKCHFCPFVALAGHDSFMEQYHKALKQEIIQFDSELRAKAPIETLFLGGGTPSTYPPHLLLDTFGTLYSRYSFAQDAEITLEVNPGTVDSDKLNAWKKAGINRLSIGVQSLNNKVLAGLNRHQTAQQVYDLLDAASDLFNNISIDLIVGLPGVTAQEWYDLIAQVITWPITHTSLYFLTLHEDTPLYFGVKKNTVQLPTDDLVVDLYHWTIEYYKQHGFYQYEISNFARPGFESAHNKIYWQRKPYKGFGLGAYSFDGHQRSHNEKNLMKYMAALEAQTCPVVFAEMLTSKQVWLEQLMLGLRQTEGLALEQITQELSLAERSDFFLQVDVLCQGGFLTYNQNRLHVTPAGLAIVNELIVKLSVV